MAWFDGTFASSDEKITAEYPVMITDDLRSAEEKNRIVIINNFLEKDQRYDLAAPDFENNKVFYHVFTGLAAKQAKNFINCFIESGHGTDAKDIDLVRRDNDRIFEYSYGEIQTDIIDNQEALKCMIPKTTINGDIFVLPLRMFRYACPVCKNRTLQWRGVFEICPECGWEDDGENDEDEVTTPNGEYTIRSYRKKYMKLKSNNPDYKWNKR